MTKSCLKITEFGRLASGKMGIKMEITWFTLIKMLLHAGLRPNLGFGIFFIEHSFPFLEHCELPPILNRQLFHILRHTLSNTTWYKSIDWGDLKRSFSIPNTESELIWKKSANFNRQKNLLWRGRIQKLIY